MPTETRPRPSIKYICNPSVANASVVATNVETVSVDSCSTLTTQGPTHSPSQGYPTPAVQQDANDGMSVIREHFKAKGVSQSATELLMASWRGGTQKPKWCLRQEMD